MTASFNNTLPTATDRIRRAVGDVNTLNALRQDEEIAAVLVLNSDDENAATADIAASLAVEYAQKPDSISDDGTAIRWGERVKTWLTIAKEFRAASVVVVEGSGGVWTEQLVREGVTDETEYDPNRIEPWY
jgi:hypothetical protein